MKFFELHDGNEKNCVANQIDNYQMEFNEGNYEHFLEDDYWSPSEEIEFIQLHLIEKGLTKFCKYFENQHSVIYGLPQLVQFCAVCHLYDTMILNYHEIQHLSEPPIPLVCLIKMDHLSKKLNISMGLKLTMIFLTTRSVFNHREKFPYLANITIGHGIRMWQSLFDQSNNETKNRSPVTDNKLFLESIQLSLVTPSALDNCVIAILLQTNPHLSHYFY